MYLKSNHCSTTDAGIAHMTMTSLKKLDLSITQSVIKQRFKQSNVGKVKWCRSKMNSTLLKPVGRLSVKVFKYIHT